MHSDCWAQKKTVSEEGGKSRHVLVQKSGTGWSGGANKRPVYLLCWELLLGLYWASQQQQQREEGFVHVEPVCVLGGHVRLGVKERFTTSGVRKKGIKKNKLSFLFEAEAKHLLSF